MPALAEIRVVAAAPCRSAAAPVGGRPRCYFSIDLEDYVHDYQRGLGLSRPRRAPQGLVEAYGRIEGFARRHLAAARLTFFTTGQVARDYPDLVRRIAGDGHEIACHYYEHDQIWHHDRETFRANLEHAIELLSRASGQLIKGFRAPDFSIDDRCAGWAYEELARLFVYDSSRVGDHHHGRPGSPEIMRFPGAYLYELPMFRRWLIPGFSVRVMGGTYARVLPLGLILKLLRESSQKGFIPQVYMHPYDLLHDCEQWSGLSELQELPWGQRMYRWLRQAQWHSIGNRGAFHKLERIYEEFEHPGPIGDLFSGARVADASAGAESERM